MGLAKRIIPTILKRGSAQVKGQRFDSWRSVGIAMQSCKIHAARGADEIVLLDIDATPSGKGPDFNAIRELAKDFLTPLAVGGGIRNMDDVSLLLDAGADKVVVRSGGLDLVNEIAHRYGSQAVIIAVDYKTLHHDCRVVVAHAKGCANAGAGEILLTDMAREGMMEGYDIDAIAEVSEAVSIPVIAHGGCGTPQHMLEAIQAGASAVAAGSIFLFTDETPKSCAQYLAEHGVEVRIP
jgi:cyclase